MLSDLFVVTVSLPAEICQGQKGRGAVLKFRFSPYTHIEFLRVAILKQFRERCDIPVQQLSKLHLCHYLEEEEGWEWLEEDQMLHLYQLPSECKLELKALEPVYRDIRVVIPQLECSLSVEYDQFSTVGDVLRQVLNTSDPPLDPSLGYSLYHVRLRTNLDVCDSMVHYQFLPNDVLECRLSIKKQQSMILSVKIPSIQSSRKVKVSLDETVGELMSTLLRRVPDPDDHRWAHMALHLTPHTPASSLSASFSSAPHQPLLPSSYSSSSAYSSMSGPPFSPLATAPPPLTAGPRGVWMEDYKFLAAYKLKPSDTLEFKPKYRPMTFEVRVFPHDHSGGYESPYANSELLVAQDALISEVVDLLCNSCSLEYDPRFYGLFLHDDTQLPGDVAMWDYLDSHMTAGYQDSLVVHMIYKPLQVSFQNEPDSAVVLLTDFSQPCQVLRDQLCRKYGVRRYDNYTLQYAGGGIKLNLQLSLHNQGVLEQENVALVPTDGEESPHLLPSSPSLCSSTSIESVHSNDSRVSMMLGEENVNIWDEGPDNPPKNIRFLHSRVVGATFNKLVEKITSSTEHDMEFVKTFLLTYQSFATPERLLHKLIERYNVVRPEGVSLREFTQMRQTIQVRVINAMKHWVELSVDFKDDVLLQNNVLNFIDTVVILDHPRFCKPLRNNILAIKGVIQKKNLKTFRDPPPPVKFPATPTHLLGVFDFDPEEIARQLTIIDFALFAKIKPCELLNQAWQKKKYKHRAQNILRLADRLNNLTLWVATTILSQRDVQERAKRITDFVLISEHLHHMHNFCTLLSVLNGLENPAITRLHKSFSKLDKHISKKLEDLQKLARPGDHFKILREDVKRASNPCIPYLGLYMSDLTFLDNGNPNFHEDGLINFSKCRLIYQQIRDLILRQDKPYNFEEVPALHESLMKFNFLDADVLYDVSLQREPRERKQ